MPGSEDRDRVHLSLSDLRPNGRSEPPAPAWSLEQSVT